MVKFLRSRSMSSMKISKPGFNLYNKSIGTIFCIHASGVDQLFIDNQKKKKHQ